MPDSLNYVQINHDFRRNNSAYFNIEHPRWGAIMGVQLTKDVKSGDEILPTTDTLRTTTQR